MKDFMGMENIMMQNIRRSFNITMVFVTMALRNAAIIRLAGSMFSPLIVSQRSRGSGRSILLRMPKRAPRSAP
eukprot:4912563-Ditylum_brightwellii.AAC.1